MIYSVIDGNPNTSFEFFKFNTGPIKLVLNVRFEKKIINNQIKLKRAFNSGSTSLKVEDILFNNKASRSIKRFIDTNHQSMMIKPSNNGELTITHLPIECDSISIIFCSDEYTVTSKGLKVFNIGLETLEFYSIEYEGEGEFNSTRIVTPENLFNLSSETNVFPDKSISYDEEISVSLNNGAKRSLLKYFDNKTKDLIIPSKQNFFNFIYSLKRNDEIISSSEEISNEDYFLNSTSLLKTVNKKISPINYAINDESCNESLKVVQGEAFIRSNKREKAINIGRISLEGENKVILPFYLKSYKIDKSDVRLYGNNYLLEQVDTLEETLIDEKKFFLNYEENSININLNQNKSVKLSMLLKPISGKIIYKNEGYYVEINEPFEYDKRLINVKTVVKDETVYESLVPKGIMSGVSIRKFYLPDQNIVYDEVSVHVEENEGWKYLQRDTATDDSYFEVLSYDAGILRFKINDGTTDDLNPGKQVKVKYKKNIVKDLKNEDFEIWGRGKNIKGLFLYPENVSFNEGAGFIDRNNPNVKSYSVDYADNIIEGTLKFDSSPFSKPYKEVEYIDGSTEFLNIKKMHKDFVPKIEWPEEEPKEVMFTSEKIPYNEGAYAAEKVLCFDKNNNEVVGKLRRDDRSPIYFHLEKPDEDNSGYSNGYYISYYYINEDFENIFKYSVDYKNGIIYFSDPPENTTTYRFKYGDVKLEYNLYYEINNYEFDKNSGIVSVETEEFSEANNKIKFFWHQVENSTSLKGLEKYYSPIVYSLKVGMN